MTAQRVVITGAGVVSPLGSGKARFFAGLREARSGVREIRSFPAVGFPVRIAAEVPDVEAAAVDLPFPEAAALRRDPKALFFVLAAREALAEALAGAALDSRFDPYRVGLSVATGLEIFHVPDLLPHLRGDRLDRDSLLAQAMREPAHAFMEIPSDLAVRCMAREAGARGPCAINVSACAAGAQALGEAFWQLRDGELDAVLAGGFDSMVNPVGVSGFSLLGALSTSNHLGAAASRPFDARRDGFVLGEGAAAFFLETAESARRRGARALAEIIGYGSTLDAFRVSDPDEHERGAVAAMTAALADAGLASEDVGYINAHGTGTRKNDPAETRAIRAVFGPAPPPASSTKSQIGHLIGAAGAVEAMAVLFALAEQTLPATINLGTPDPECDLDYVPEQPRPARVRFALSNSFGFGGQNACLAFAAAHTLDPMKEQAMSEPETPVGGETVQARIARCVAQVLAKPADQVSPQSRLIDDLGADSLDLIELMYVLEDEFAMKLDKQDLSLSAQLGLPESEVHDNEVLTPKALAMLRERYPQAEELLKDGVTRMRLASLLTVEALAVGLAKKVAAKEASHVAAG